MSAPLVMLAPSWKVTVPVISAPPEVTVNLSVVVALPLILIPVESTSTTWVPPAVITTLLVVVASIVSPVAKVFCHPEHLYLLLLVSWLLGLRWSFLLLLWKLLWKKRL